MTNYVGEGHLHLAAHSGRNCLYLFQVVSNHCRCTPRGVMGVKWPEILWEIQKYSLPSRPSSQNWVKSETIYHFLRNFDEFLNGFWFYSILAGWSTWQWVFLNFSQNFWSFDTHDTPGCASTVIWNHLKQIWVIPPTVRWQSSVFDKNGFGIYDWTPFAH